MSEKSPLVLVVDDEPDICDLIKDILNDEGYQAISASNGAEARSAFSSQQPNLTLLDIWMPDIDGISLLKEFKQSDANTTIIMMSGHGTIETAIEATRLGAADFIEKPVSIAKLLRSIEAALEKREKQTVIEQQQIVEPVGKSTQLTLLREQSQRVAKHGMPILLQGEDGVGKHCFARYLHQLGAFSNSKLIELTHESFPTDSNKLIALADNNCLFINDIALLPSNAQALLSHLIDTQKLSHCQLICATQYSLENAINQGDFIEGLLYQINSITLSIPTLRDHIEDVPDLVHFFVDQQTAQGKLPYRHFTVAAQNRLRNYHWQGNVLELKNVIQRLLVLGDAEEIDIESVEQALQKEAISPEINQNRIDYDLPLRESREQFERIYLLRKLKQAEGNVGKAAKLAGMERTHLYRKLRGLDIDAKQI